MDPTMTHDADALAAPEMDAAHAIGEAAEAAIRVAVSKAAWPAGARRIALDLGDDGSITVAVTDAPTAPLEGEATVVSMDEIVAAIDADTAAEMSAPPPPPAA